MNQTAVAPGDCVKVTAAGFIHLRILCERLEYLYGILTVTPISEHKAAEQIADYIRRESRLGQMTASSMGRCIEEFLNISRCSTLN